MAKKEKTTEVPSNEASSLDAATCVGPTQSISFTCIQSIASDIRKGQFTVVTLRKILLQLDAAVALLPGGNPNLGAAVMTLQNETQVARESNPKLEYANRLDMLAMRLPSPEEASTASLADDLLGSLIDTLIQLILQFYRSV